MTATTFVKGGEGMKRRRERVCYSIAIDKDLVEALRALSENQDLSIAHLIRKGIRLLLDQQQPRISA
jgi:hypothetical protein